ILHGNQSLIKAACYREQRRLGAQNCWLGVLQKGLEEIGMGFILHEGEVVRKNVWRKVKKRLIDINRQEIEGDCRKKITLEIQTLTSINWGKETYLEWGTWDVRRGLAWLRLGVWRVNSFKDAEGQRKCPLCGEVDSWLHKLANCSAFDDLRQRFPPKGQNDPPTSKLLETELKEPPDIECIVSPQQRSSTKLRRVTAQLYPLRTNSDRRNFTLCALAKLDIKITAWMNDLVINVKKNGMGAEYVLLAVARSRKNTIECCLLPSHSGSSFARGMAYNIDEHLLLYYKFSCFSFNIKHVEQAPVDGDPKPIVVSTEKVSEREYRRVHNEVPLFRHTINRWNNQLKETGTFLDQKRRSKPSVRDESITYAYIKDIRLNDIEIDKEILKKIVFSDEAIFHVCGHVHRHNVRIRAYEYPHICIESSFSDV
ncbi:hypothetical protein C0J52_20187, partial [Blattella germanica]